MNTAVARFKKLTSHLILKDWFNILILVLLCLLFYAITGLQNTITWRTDSYFHFNRVHDITESIKSFSIPNVINFSSFDYTGQAVNAMYPTLTLLPFIILTAWLQPIAQYAMINFFFILAGSILNYFVFQRFNCSKVQSLVATISFFPLINIFSSYHLSLQGVWGIYFLLPLAILSLWKMSHGHKYYTLTLALSISLLINLHVLSSILSVMLLSSLFFLLLTQTNNKKNFLFSFLVASIISAVLSLPTLVDIISFSSNKLTSVNRPILANYTMTLEDMIRSLGNLPFTGTSTPEIYGYLLVLDIFICLNWKKIENKHAKNILIISFILQLVISPYFPWSLLQNTPIAIIQFPNRIAPIIITLQLLGIFTSSRLKTKSFLITFAMLSIFLTMSHIWTNYSERKTLPLLTTAMINDSIKGKINSPSVNETKIDTTTMNYQDFYQFSSFIEYVPTKFMKNSQNTVSENEKSVNQHITYTNRKIAPLVKITHNFKSITYYFNKPQTGEIDLPFWNYQNIQYQVYSNGKKIKYNMSTRNTILLKDKAVSKVTITSKNPNIYSLSLIICITGWMITMLFVITKIKKNILKV